MPTGNKYAGGKKRLIWMNMSGQKEIKSKKEVYAKYKASEEKRVKRLQEKISVKKWEPCEYVGTIFLCLGASLYS